MDGRASAIRHVLSTTDPKRAAQIVRSFELPEEEEKCIIERDIKRKSIIQISMELATSPETVKRRRRSGLSKMADAINL